MDDNDLNIEYLRDIDPKIRALAYPFQVHKLSRQIAEQPDYDSYIKELIHQVVLTVPGERINRPDFGSGVGRMVFEAGAAGASTFSKAIILSSLQKWLGELITVEAIETRFEDTTLFIEIHYIVLHRGTRRFLNLEVTP